MQRNPSSSSQRSLYMSSTFQPSELPRSNSSCARAAALADPNVQRYVEGREPRRVVYVPGRLINIVP